MPIKIEDGWKCAICDEIFPRDIDALSHEQQHDIIYVPIKSSDLFRLIQFIFTKDESLLTESLMKTLLKYSARL